MRYNYLNNRTFRIKSGGADLNATPESGEFFDPTSRSEEDPFHNQLDLFKN